MGWMQKLNEVYDTMIEIKPEDDINQVTLIPVGFVQKPVKYLVTLTRDGNFLSAREQAEDEISCIIPSTPQAEARTGDNGTPFPLAEQMKYLVCDPEENPRLEKYLSQLNDWCSQPNAPVCLKTLYIYLEKKTLLQDMCSISGLKIKYHKDETKKDEDGADAKAFVCFAVQDLFAEETRLWKREDVLHSWIQYTSRDTSGDAMLCYATGERRKPLESHPKVQGNAKLISAKDAAYPFQYKGRFSEDRSAATVSAYASIRAHNALKYLMEKQGFRKYGLQIVAWNVKTGSLRTPLEEPDEEDDEEELPDTFEHYADALREAAEGNGERLKHFQEQIGCCNDAEDRAAATVILGLETATDGRMSINYYQELEGNTHVKRLTEWYESCCWEYYHKNQGFLIRTPTPLMIARAVMGEGSVQRARQDMQCKKSDVKQLRDLYKRLLSCIVDGASLPQNILYSAVHRAEFPMSFKTSSGSWQRKNWDNCVRTTCALIRRSRFDRKQAEVTNRLDADCDNRDYLYGRLFAVADALEKEASENKDLPTNAIRMMQFFVQRPAEAWKQLHLKLVPYLQKLSKREHSAARYQKLLGQIEQQFKPDERSKNASLREDFLLGLYAQNRELYSKPEERVSTAEPVLEYRPSNDRNELFGCMLAVADCAEWYAESKDNEENKISGHDGATLALRFMTKFAVRPAETWEQIHERLLPYLEKLGVQSSGFYFSQLHKLECCFDRSDRLSNAPLDSMFLHGYYCMRQCIRTRDAKLVVPEFAQNEAAESREEAFAKLLALENRIERIILDLEKSEDENRISNAVRFMSKFAKSPDAVWNYLEERMQPYLRKLKSVRSGWADRQRSKLEALRELIADHHWNTDEPLKNGWLHFYYVNYYCNKGE